MMLFFFDLNIIKERQALDNMYIITQNIYLPLFEDSFVVIVVAGDVYKVGTLVFVKYIEERYRRCCCLNKLF